jgi:hypothetical protein
MFYLVDGWSVYQFENLRSEANLMDFARGGYKKLDVSMERSGGRASVADTFLVSRCLYLDEYSPFHFSFLLWDRWDYCKEVSFTWEPQ